jgi:3-deoxy-D-arabino-heptulosonate 7-phosphate (DAHP) synthase
MGDSHQGTNGAYRDSPRTCVGHRGLCHQARIEAFSQSDKGILCSSLQDALMALRMPAGTQLTLAESRIRALR